MSEPLVQLHNVTRSFSNVAETVYALRELNLCIQQGESVAIVGASGSGKSSLLNILGLLDRPTQGTHAFAGECVEKLDNPARTRLRNQHIGFVFQQFHLIAQIDAFHNVALPLQYAHVEPAIVAQRVTQALDAVGLAKRMHHMPYQLSGGERQRVAIARAMVNTPRLLLADEPTGALDTQNGEQIFELMLGLQAHHGVTLVVVTHDTELAKRLQRSVHLRDGSITFDG